MSLGQKNYNPENLQETSTQPVATRLDKLGLVASLMDKYSSLDVLFQTTDKLSFEVTFQNSRNGS
jgi:hypothetical protein